MSKFNAKLNDVSKLMLEMAYGANPNATEITYDQLIEKISGIEEPDKPVKFTSITVATGRKKNPETGVKIQDVYKVSQVEAKMNVSYKEKRTEAGRAAGELGAEEEHRLGRTYGTHDTATIVDYLGKKYIQLMPVSALTPQYVIKNNVGQLNAASKEEAKPYLRDFVQPPGAAAEVPIRRYQLSSIVAIEIDGQDYKITDVEPARRLVLDLVDINPERELE